MRLGELAHGRANNFNLIRFAAASAVIVFHSYALTGRWTDEPLWRLAPELNFGALGVKIFFVISGFLVTQSWLARNAAVRFDDCEAAFRNINTQEELAAAAAPETRGS